MPYKDKEKEKEYHKEYSKNWKNKNRLRFREQQQAWRDKNKDKTHDYQQKYYWANREKEIIRIMQGNKKRYRKQRLEVIEHYGRICACCGENRTQFLGIDHINGNGNKHRKELRAGHHRNIVEFLIKAGYPEGYRVLCHNCNLSIGFYGFCPHQLERGEIAEEDIEI
jgi:hypothetical protein